MTFLSEVHGAVEEAKNKPVPEKKKEVTEEIETLRIKNAVLEKGLEIKNKDSANLFKLYQEERKKNENVERALKMIRGMDAHIQTS